MRLEGEVLLYTVAEMPAMMKAANDLYVQTRDERDKARELAAMYLRCLNSRALERGETVEDVASFCNEEFKENPWLKIEYEKLTETEAAVKSFMLRSKGGE